MKKMIAGAFVATLMSAGLVASTGGTAMAACPYTGCISTSTVVSAPGTVSAGNKAVIKVKVNPGSASPKGTVKIIVKRKGGGYFASSSQSYKGGSVFLSTGTLTKKGKYTVVAKFIPKAGSAFLRSSGSAAFKVVK